MNEEAVLFAIMVVAIFAGSVISAIFNKLDTIMWKLDVVIKLIKDLR